MSYDKNINNLLKSNLDKIELELNKRFSLLKKGMGNGFNKLSTKLKSELLSNLVETSTEETISGAIAPTKDYMPDLVMVNKPLEIKATATSDAWRGGEFSKRPGDYVMVGWEEVKGKLKLFILHTFLTKEDWTSSNSDNYYATTISLTEIVENVKYSILKGGLLKKRIKTHMVKV